MDALYIYKGRISKGARRHLLLEKAYDYASCEGLFTGDYRDFVNKVKVHVDDRNRPFIDAIPMDFSISHSGDYWASLFSHERCGLDIQAVREVDYLRIANRFFGVREIEYVKKFGKDAFFDIWVRREAYGKMTGIGFYCDPPSFIDRGLRLKDTVKYQRVPYLIYSPLEDGQMECSQNPNANGFDDEFIEKYKCAICSLERDLRIFSDI